jgi:hypothetical protein
MSMIAFVRRASPKAGAITEANVWSRFHEFSQTYLPESDGNLFCHILEPGKSRGRLADPHRVESAAA